LATVLYLPVTDRPVERGLAMGGRAVTDRGWERRPSVGEWVGLVLKEGFVLLVGAIVGGMTEWPALPWIVGAVMVLVLVRWLVKLRSPSESVWGGAGDRGGLPTNATSYDGTGGGGIA
jgi:hypothetical protein